MHSSIDYNELATKNLEEKFIREKKKQDPKF